MPLTELAPKASSTDRAGLKAVFVAEAARRGRPSGAAVAANSPRIGAPVANLTLG